MRRMQPSSPMPRAARRPGAGEVIFEFVAIGNSVKVSAIDPVSMREVSIVGPVNAGEEALRRAALAKLRRMLARERDGASPRPGGLYA